VDLEELVYDLMVAAAKIHLSLHPEDATADRNPWSLNHGVAFLQQAQSAYAEGVEALRAEWHRLEGRAARSG